MSKRLENLAGQRLIDPEPFDQAEFDGLLEIARTQLNDARVDALSTQGRFFAAYGASHAIARAALRRHGYRSDKRYLLFQLLDLTLGLETAQWKLLDLCHKRRNRAEYDGQLDVNEQLVSELVKLAELMLERIQARAG